MLPGMNDDVFPLGERGRTADGRPRTVDYRLYLQLLAYGRCRDLPGVIRSLQQAAEALPGFDGALYKDLNDPYGIGVLAAHEDADFFAGAWRDVLQRPPFADLEPKPEYTMFGRTYSIGYEVDLEDTLLHRTRRRICEPAYAWAVWYPLRRSGSFERLSSEDQRAILMEHAHLGISFSRTGMGNDIRLACHGIDQHDNDFVIGLVGKELYPLSAMVQAMRSTTQTSLHLDRLGPFFVGRVAWQSRRPVEAAVADTATARE